MASSLSNAFNSEKLVYQAIENSEEEKAWFHREIKNDPEALALGDCTVVRPQTRRRSEEALLEISKSLLGVFICLKPPPRRGEDGRGDDGVEPKPDPEQSQQPTRIGVLCLTGGEDDGSYTHHHRLCMLTISLAAAHRCKGYGREALDWAVDWAFMRANVHCLSLGCVEFNERGRRLYEKAGFVLEGRFRQSHWHERRWWDLLLYSMLEDEWVELRKGRSVVEDG